MIRSPFLTALVLVSAAVGVAAGPACTRPEAPKPLAPALPSAPGRDGIPVVSIAGALSSFEPARVEGLLRWGGSVVVRREDGFHVIDAEATAASRLEVPGIATIVDLCESGGRAYVLGDAASEGPAVFHVREGSRWVEVALPPEIRLARGLWLAGGEDEPWIVTPLEAWRREGTKWVDYRFQGMFVPFRQGTRFALGKRLVSVSRLGMVGGQARWVDLGVTPRVWRELRLPAFYDLTAIVRDGNGKLWAGASRLAGGINRSVIFGGEPGGLKPAADLAFGEADRSWPSVLGLVPRGSGELLLLLTSSIARLGPERDSAGSPRGPEILARFDFPVEAFFDFVEDAAGNLYFATEYSGVYQLRLPESGRAEVRRVRF